MAYVCGPTMGKPRVFEDGRKEIIRLEFNFLYIDRSEYYTKCVAHFDFLTCSAQQCVLCFADGLVELLVAVVGLSPSLCESIQVETMLGAYHATTAKTGKPHKLGGGEGGGLFVLLGND